MVSALCSEICLWIKNRMENLNGSSQLTEKINKNDFIRFFTENEEIKRFFKEKNVMVIIFAFFKKVSSYDVFYERVRIFLEGEKRFPEEFFEFVVSRIFYFILDRCKNSHSPDGKGI